MQIKQNTGRQGGRPQPPTGLLRFAGVFASCLLAACAAPTKRESPAPAVVQSVHPVAIDADLPLKLIGAELAVQKNDLASAARRYADAAELSDDADIAEQATRLALAVKQWPLAHKSLARWQALDPKSVGLLQSRAWIALAEGEIEPAFAALDTLVQRGGDGPWRLAAQVMIGAGNKVQALALLERLAVPGRLGDNSREWVAMSQLAFKLGDKALAGRLADAAVARFKSADAYAWSAKLALDRGEKAKAREQYADALERDPESLQLRSGYAAMLADSGDYAGAARALAEGPQSDVIYGARAAYAARAEDKSLQAALYRSIQSDKSPRTGKRLYLLGQIAELAGKDDEAADWYRQVSEDDENWLEAGIRGVVLVDKKGDDAAALQRIGELRLAAGAGSPETVQLILLEAELLSRKGRKAEAMAAYSRGLDQLPGDSRLLYARAMLAIELDDIDSGERDLRSVLVADPESADALNALGYTLADRTDRLVEANELIEKAIRIRPDEPAILDSHGWIKYRLGHLDEAITLLRQAYAKQPDSEVAAHLGEVLWVRGNRDEARRIWEQGREKDAGNKVLVETMKRLAS